MAVSSQFKVNQLAKDLSLKAKDLTDLFAEGGIDVKTQKALTSFELDYMWEKLTVANQVSNIEDYIDGVTGIPSTRKKAKAEKPQPVAEETKEKSAPTPPPQEKAPAKEEKSPRSPHSNRI